MPSVRHIFHTSADDFAYTQSVEESRERLRSRKEGDLVRRAAAAGIASQIRAIGDAACRLPCARRASTQRWWPARRTSVGCCPAAWPTCWSCLPWRSRNRSMPAYWSRLGRLQPSSTVGVLIGATPSTPDDLADQGAALQRSW